MSFGSSSTMLSWHWFLEKFPLEILRSSAQSTVLSCSASFYYFFSLFLLCSWGVSIVSVTHFLFKKLWPVSENQITLV